MLLRLFLVFTLVPLVELYLLVQLARATSFGLTVAIILITGILGSWLARNQGLQVWGRFQQTLRSGRMPGRELQEGFMIAFAAALLLTPGLLTDLLGFLLLAPPTREIMRRMLARRLRHRFHMKVTHFGGGFGGDAGSSPRPGDDSTLDAEGVRPVDAPDRDEPGSDRIEQQRRT